MAMDIGAHPRRIYAVVRLSYLADAFKVDKVTSVPYQSVRLPIPIPPRMHPNHVNAQTSSSGAPEHPRIQLIQNGALICVQFGDAVALCARG
jgi:nuclear pore complex protein Nup133